MVYLQQQNTNCLREEFSQDFTFFFFLFSFLLVSYPQRLCTVTGDSSQRRVNRGIERQAVCLVNSVSLIKIWCCMRYMKERWRSNSSRSFKLPVRERLTGQGREEGSEEGKKEVKMESYWNAGWESKRISRVIVLLLRCWGKPWRPELLATGEVADREDQLHFDKSDFLPPYTPIQLSPFSNVLMACAYTVRVQGTIFVLTAKALYNHSHAVTHQWVAAAVHCHW